MNRGHQDDGRDFSQDDDGRDFSPHQEIYDMDDHASDDVDPGKSFAGGFFGDSAFAPSANRQFRNRGHQDDGRDVSPHQELNGMDDHASDDVDQDDGRDFSPHQEKYGMDDHASDDVDPGKSTSETDQGNSDEFDRTRF